SRHQQDNGEWQGADYCHALKRVKASGKQQHRRNHALGGCPEGTLNGRCIGNAPAARESITSDAESDDVTKNVTIKITVTNETMAVNGRRSSNLNSAIALLSCTSAISET